MKNCWPILIAVLLISVPALAADETTAPETRTLNGKYVWDARGSEGDLEAVFTPAGENRWDVKFHFEFRGRAHTYSGTAEGSLGEGALSGTVLNENEKRTFTFSGEFSDGAFKGSHAERHGESEVETGTLELEEG